MWFGLALVSAVLYGFRSVLEKRIIGRTNTYVLGLAIRLFALPFFFLPFLIDPSLFVPLNQLDWQFWTALAMLCFISTPIETFLYYEALKDEEASLVVPILSLSPVVTIFFSFVVFQSLPSVLGFLGILLIGLGVYALKLGHAKEGLLQPLYHLYNNRAVRLMGLVMISLALSAVLVKIGVTQSNAYFFSLVNYITVTIVLFAIAKAKAGSSLHQLRSHFTSFLVVGLVVAGYTIFNSLALSTGDAAYVSAIRNAGIVFTVLFGYLLLKERNIRDKLTAVALIGAGLIVIKLYG